MAQRLGSPIPIRLPVDLEEGLHALVRERGGTQQQAIREALRDYLEREARLKKQDELEARMAASLGRLRKDVRLARNDVHVLMAFFDQFVRSYLLHTPPLVEEARDSQSASAHDRYQKLLRLVPQALQNGDGLSALVESGDVSGDDA